MLIHARVQEALGTYCQLRGDLELSQKYFTKSLRMVSDLSELDEDSALNFMEVENLKGKETEFFQKKYCSDTFNIEIQLFKRYKTTDVFILSWHFITQVSVLHINQNNCTCLIF